MTQREIFTLHLEGETHGTYLTMEAAEAVEETLDGVTEIRIIPVDFPLDPFPWTSTSHKDRLHSLPQWERSWRFIPRPGFATDSGLYGGHGGIDPLPFLIVPPAGLVPRGRVRWETTEFSPSNCELIFSPRPGFETDPTLYKKLPQDPTPWGSTDGGRFRHNDPHVNYEELVFSPIRGFDQLQENYG